MKSRLCRGFAWKPARVVGRAHPLSSSLAWKSIRPSCIPSAGRMNLYGKMDYHGLHGEHGFSEVRVFRPCRCGPFCLMPDGMAASFGGMRSELLRTSILSAGLAWAGVMTAAAGDPEAVTTPIGFTTELLHPGLNIVGLRLHHAVVVTGRIGKLEGDWLELDIPAKDLSSGQALPLEKGATYILEIGEGKQRGAIQEIQAWEGLRKLRVPENLAAGGVEPGTKVTIRKAATLLSVFGGVRSVLAKDDSPGRGDVVIIPEPGKFSGKICYLDGAGTWRDVETGGNMGRLPLIYPDAVLVQRRGNAPIGLPQQGEIKEGPSRVMLVEGENYVSVPGAATSTLQELGLEKCLAKGRSTREADEVVVGESYGRMTSYHLDPQGRWILSENGTVVENPVKVPSGIGIRRKSGAVQISIAGNE